MAFTIYGALQALSIPGHHAVGHEGQSARGGDEFFGAPAALCGQRLGTDLPLQGMNRLSAFEHSVQGTTEVGQREVIAQVDRAQ